MFDNNWLITPPCGRPFNMVQPLQTVFLSGLSKFEWFWPDSWRIRYGCLTGVTELSWPRQSKIGCNIVNNACWMMRSSTVGIPNNPMLPSSLRVATHRTGRAWYVLPCGWVARYEDCSASQPQSRSSSAHRFWQHLYLRSLASHFTCYSRALAP